MPTQVWSLLSLGVGLNLVLGALVAAFKLPIYLDSLGTVLVAALAGPGAACLAGGCGVALLGLTNPVALAFMPVGMVVGLLAGWAARLGAFSQAWRAGLCGALVGVAGAALSAPISAFMFGGVTGGGTDLMVALFRAGGLSTIGAAFSQGLTVDPLDKAATFLLVFALLEALPRRATAAFPLADRLAAHPRGVPAYQPQRQLAQRPGRRALPAGEAAESRVFPQAATEWKLAAALSVMAVALLTPRPAPLTVAFLAVWLADLAVAFRLTCGISRRMALVLLPLAVSLALIHGLLVVVPNEVRLPWLGLTWSPSGLRAAWHFLARVATMLLALSFFLATTPLLRLSELLLRWRVPYPLVFVLLTGANLGRRLRQRWAIVEEAQASRGLLLHTRGLRARGRVLMSLLTPTLGAVFNEIPLRAANLESRGFLTARPRWAVPLGWNGESEPTLTGTLYHGALCLAAWGFLWWLWF